MTQSHLQSLLLSAVTMPPFPATLDLGPGKAVGSKGIAEEAAMDPGGSHAVRYSAFAVIQ